MRIATILVMAGPAETTWGEFARGELRRSGARAGAARDAVVEFLAAQDCCVTAQELGMHAVHFRDTDQAIAEIEAALARGPHLSR